MRIFLSARYGRRLELCGYRDELAAMGHTVCARWLHGPELELSSGWLGQSFIDAIEDDTLTQCGLRAELAHIDIKDIMAAECFVSFTEPRGSDASRGGRHVELGIFLSSAIECTEFNSIEIESAGQRPVRLVTRMNPIRIIVVGHRENLFHWLPEIEFHETWEDAKKCLT